MIKKIIIPALLLIPLAGCASDSRDTQCEEDKNYVITNPIEIEDFLKQKEEGKIKGFYSYHNIAEACDYGDCMEFSRKFEYIERNFIFKGKESIYTIERIYDLQNTECLEENWLKIKKKKNYCYIVKENKDKIIKSEYTFNYYNNKTGTRKINMINNKNGETLFERSYQTYSANYIGAVGGGNCPPKKQNHSEYNLDIWSLIE